MYIGLHKIKSQEENDGIINVTLKDGKNYSFNKELFDLIASEELDSNGKEPYDVVVHTLATAMVQMTAKYGLTIIEAVASTQRATNLISVFRDNKIAEKFGVKDVSDIKVKDLI